jgi:probable HAF family extracellular repeat protein
MLDLGTLGGNDAAAEEVNESGQIVGVSYTNTLPSDTTGIPTVHTFLWQNGAMTDLGSLGGTLVVPGSLTENHGTRVVNDSGDVAGTSTLAGDQVWHAFFWSHGTMVDLGTLGGSNSEVFALNNKGQVVGRAHVSDTPFVRHAFLWEKGHMTDLHTLAGCTRSTAQSINSAAQVVGGLGGCSDNPDDVQSFFSAFYVEKGKPMVDLNTLIDPPSPIHIDSPWNINERGEIFGSGLLPDGTTRAFLLVPLPGR